MGGFVKHNGPHPDCIFDGYEVLDEERSENYDDCNCEELWLESHISYADSMRTRMKEEGVIL